MSAPERSILMIPDQPAGLDRAAESPFDDPSLRQDFEALHVVAPLDDLKVDLAVPFQLGDFAFELTGVAAVRPDPLEPAECGGEDRQQ